MEGQECQLLRVTQTRKKQVKCDLRGQKRYCSQIFKIHTQRGVALLCYRRPQFTCCVYGRTAPKPTKRWRAQAQQPKGNFHCSPPRPLFPQGPQVRGRTVRLGPYPSAMRFRCLLLSSTADARLLLLLPSPSCSSPSYSFSSYPLPLSTCVLGIHLFSVQCFFRRL